MPENELLNLVTQEDLKLITKHLNQVKRSRFGEVLIMVSDGRIVYLKHIIGEQITKEIKHPK